MCTSFHFEDNCYLTLSVPNSNFLNYCSWNIQTTKRWGLLLRINGSFISRSDVSRHPTRSSHLGTIVKNQTDELDITTAPGTASPPLCTDFVLLSWSLLLTSWLHRAGLQSTACLHTISIHTMMQVPSSCTPLKFTFFLQLPSSWLSLSFRNSTIEIMPLAHSFLKSQCRDSAGEGKMWRALLPWTGSQEHSWNSDAPQDRLRAWRKWHEFFPTFLINAIRGSFAFSFYHPAPDLNFPPKLLLYKKQQHGEEWTNLVKV